MLPGSLNSKLKSASASSGATFSMRSSALTRLCACLALLALALKRSMNFCRWAILSCCLEKADCCSSSCCGAQRLEGAVVAAVARELLAFAMCSVTSVTASRNSRSWLITIMVPAYFCSQASSQTSASRSRWLVGSSSSSRSLGHISARASCRRMRQPPEKLLTGCVQLVRLEAQAQDQRLRARHGVVLAGVGQVGVGVGQRHADVVRRRGRRRGRPRPARAPRAAPPGACRRPARSRWPTPSVSGMFCATCAMRHCGGTEKSPPSSCSVPLNSANRVDLPAPLRPTRPTFSPGLMVTLAPSSSTLALRRRMTFLRVIM